MSASADTPLRVEGDFVVMVAGNPWDGNRLGCHHVAVELARRVPLLWVDPPISYLTPLNDPTARTALRDDRLRGVAPNILRLSPVTVPGVTRPVLREVAQRQARRAVRRAVERIGGRVHATIVVGLNDMLDIVPGARRVLVGTDDYVAGAALMGTDPRWLARLERRQLAKAEIVYVVSPTLQEKWTRLRSDVALIPNGCDAAHFATADDAPLPADVTLDGPIAGFVGHMSERIDLAMLEAVAAAGVSLLLVGPRQPTFDVAKLDALLARPNVQWVGSKPFAELPSYLRVIDVGLTPYQQSDFNRASFPLKTLEYLAAGRPAVVSDLPAHRWLQTPHVTIASAPQDFAARTQALLAVPLRRQDVDARRAFAERHSWAARTDEIARLIGLDGARDETLGWTA
jgi:teichuronic acid biosynthesis glycosyltransferase TuaH